MTREEATKLDGWLNLALLRDAEKGMTFNRKQHFECILLGVLASKTTEQDWREALEIALKCVNNLYPEAA